MGQVVDIPESALIEQRRLETESTGTALVAVRSAAANWAAASTGLFGAGTLAALLAGPSTFRSLAEPWSSVGPILYVFGSAVGIAGGLVATWAAQVKFKQSLLTPAKVKAFGAEALRDAVSQLQTARVLTVIGVVLLLGSSSTIWLSPEEDKPTLVQGISPSGELVCGEVANRGTTVVLATAGSDVPLESLEDPRPAKSCPAGKSSKP